MELNRGDRRMSHARALVLCASLWVAGSVCAQTTAVQWVDGEQLLEFCTSYPDSQAIQTCYGYITGVNDAHVTLLRNDVLTGRQYCVAEGVTLIEMHAVVVDYLQNATDVDKTPGSTLVMNALIRAYPCE